MFCCTLLYVHSSIAIILIGKRELITLLNSSSWCLVMVERLFLAVPRGCLQFVIVVFPDHTHLLFFRQNYSTLDHVFSLHALLELLKSQKQKLFCCFVDFSSAFDKVWRTGLWNKVIQHGINGKIFRVIRNMYDDI